MIKHTDWLQIANVAMRENRARKIIRDSDGNPSRLAYRDGAAAAAAEIASRAFSQQGGIQAICETLAAYEYPVLLPDEALRTS